MSSAGRRTSFRPGRSSITGRVRAVVMTAAAWSRVRDLDGRPQGEVPHAHRRAGVPGGHRGQGPAHVGGGQLSELAGADDFQDWLQDVLVLLDCLGGAAVEPGGEPVLGGLAYGVVDVAGLGDDPLVE